MCFVPLSARAGGRRQKRPRSIRVPVPVPVPGSCFHFRTWLSSVRPEFCRAFACSHAHAGVGASLLGVRPGVANIRPSRRTTHTFPEKAVRVGPPLLPVVGALRLTKHVNVQVPLYHYGRSSTRILLLVHTVHRSTWSCAYFRHVLCQFNYFVRCCVTVTDGLGLAQHMNGLVYLGWVPFGFLLGILRIRIKKTKP